MNSVHRHIFEDISDIYSRINVFDQTPVSDMGNIAK